MPALNIYKLARSDDDRDKVDYDDARAVIVIAATPGDAREMAALAEGAQSSRVWYLPSTSLELVGQAAPLLAGQVLLTQGY